jgi:hypothetical protein
MQHILRIQIQGLDFFLPNLRKVNTNGLYVWTNLMENISWMRWRSQEENKHVVVGLRNRKVVMMKMIVQF